MILLSEQEMKQTFDWFSLIFKVSMVILGKPGQGEESNTDSVQNRAYM